MLPTYWRFLLTQFLKVLILSTAAFVVILLTTRLDDIAHFATMGSTLWLIMRFTANQVPYILPIAIPVSCLISAMLLFQRLSTSYELTALRSSGISIRRIMVPIIICAGYLCFLNFFIVSELATDSHLFNNTIKNEVRSINPLMLLKSKHILKLKGIHFDTLGSSKAGKQAEDVLIAMPNHNNTHLHVVIAKGLKASSEKFAGDQISLITRFNDEDSLVIENVKHTTITVPEFSSILSKNTSKLHPDHLRWSLLKTKLDEDKISGKKKEVRRIYTEMVRRFAVAFAALTFTFMGAAFGVSIGRRPSYKGVFTVIGLSALFLICYFAAKGVDDKVGIASTLYIAPQIVIIVFSIISLKRVSRGIE